MLDFIGGLIGAGTKLLGGIFSNNESEKIAQQNIAAQQQYAQNRIQWTVDDAKKAGINPLAALGNATQSFSNVVGSTALGDSIGDAGQSLGRAVAAASPLKQRAAELELQLAQAKIDNIKSDTVANQARASAIATRLGAPGTPPAYPVADLPPGVVQHAAWGDPRGPVQQLEARYWDRDGKLTVIPSEKAASPLQTLAALPTNAYMALRSGIADYATPWLTEAYGSAARAVQDFNAAVYDRNNPY